MHLYEIWKLKSIQNAYDMQRYICVKLRKRNTRISGVDINRREI